MRVESIRLLGLLAILPCAVWAQNAPPPGDLPSVPAVPPGVEMPAPNAAAAPASPPIAALPAQTASGAAAGTAVAAPPLVSTAPQPVRETEGLDKTLTDLVEIRRKTAAGQAQLEQLGVERDIQQMQQEMQLETGVSAVPELIAITGNGEWMEAEFKVGTSSLTARPGDWINHDWQVIKMLNNGVVLQKRGERKTRLLMFGNRGTPPLFNNQMPTVAPPGPKH